MELKKKHEDKNCVMDQPRPNFLVGCEDGHEEAEATDEFPMQLPSIHNGLSKPLSDMTLNDKRKRLR